MPLLQTDDISATVYSNPGCRLQDIGSRVKDMTSDKTDVTVLHLGTNNALEKSSNTECRIQCLKALEVIESTHRQSRPDVPMLVCSIPPTDSRKGQLRVDDLNALLWSYCQRQSSIMTFLDTGVTLTDIGRDGVHLTLQGKVKVTSAILSAIDQDFHELLQTTKL